MSRNQVGNAPQAQDFPVLSRQVDAEPRVMPELLYFDVGPQLSLGWGTRDPEATGHRQGWWKVIDLSGHVIPALVQGLVFVIVGGVVGWIGLNFEPVQDSSWAIYFILGFGLILALAGIRMMLDPWGRRAINLPPTAEPGPWQYDYAWRETVRTENGSGHKEGMAHQVKTFVFLPIIAGILIVLHAPLFLAPEELHAVHFVGSGYEISGPTIWLLMVVVIDLLVFAALGAMIYTVIQWLRFGRPRFRLLNLPARPGGPMQAELHFSRGVPASGNAEVSLHCLDASPRPEAAADSETPSAVVSLYSETRQLKTSRLRVRHLRFEFELPADAPSTSIRNQPRIIWRLIIRIPTRGLDYHGEFLVPVYA